MARLVRPASMLALALAVSGVLGSCDDSNRYVAPPPPKVTVALPEQRQITPYLETTGSTAAVNQTNLVARVAGLCRGHQVQGRFAGHQGHGPVRHRARALPGEARAGQGGEGGRRGIAEAARSRLSAPVRPGEAPGRRRSSTSIRAGGARQRPEQARPGGGSTPSRPRSISAIPRSRRRSTASSPPARSRSASSSAPATPTVLATITQIDPIYVNFNISESDVLESARERCDKPARRSPT